ncbi:phage head closure protein [Priestia aryabhattai]|uniref:phage head closure protein n=1 Tax=Priestia aryabhattai TaxID=412384 RepID=UPI003CB81099
MKTSDFNKRITLQEEKMVKNRESITTKQYIDLVTVWAAVKTPQGREYYQAAAIQSEKPMRFVIRYSASIKRLLNNKLRISYDGRSFNITSFVNDNELNKTFTIIVEEVMK